MRCSLRSRPSSRSNTSLRRSVASRMPRPNTSAPPSVIGARPRVMRYPPSAHSPQPVHAVARVRSSSTRELDRVRICTEPNQSSTRKAYLELSPALGLRPVCTYPDPSPPSDTEPTPPGPPPGGPPLPPSPPPWVRHSRWRQRWTTEIGRAHV